MVIGYFDVGYPTKRMILNKVTNEEYVKIHNSLDLRHLFIKIFIRKFENLNKLPFTWQFSYKPLIQQRCDVVHSINTICFIKRPWVVSFENYFPSWGYGNISKEQKKKFFDKCAKAIIKDNCLGMLAMSQWAYDQTVNLWKDNMEPAIFQKCLTKLRVLEPPQELMVTRQDIESKYLNIEKLEFVFVGNDFWRKRGYDLVKVLSEFYGEYDFHLSVVSSLSIDKYKIDVSDWLVNERDEIAKNMEDSDWISWYSSIDNEDVLEIIKASHVGFCPTYSDTYGFSILEMLAGGCPVVSTGSRAQSEINDDNMGWIIHISEEEIRDNDYFDRSKPIVATINNGLRNTIYEILNSDIEAIKHKALHCIDFIEKEHSPEKYEEALRKIYGGGTFSSSF